MGDYAEQMVKNCAIANVIVPLVRNAAIASGTVVSLKNHDHVTFIIHCGALAAVNAAVTLQQETAVAGATATALAFTTYSTNAGAIASTTMADVACASTFNLATAGATYVIEVDADSLNTTAGFDCVRLYIAAAGAGDLLYGAVAILSKSRYAGATAAMSNAFAD